MFRKIILPFENNKFIYDIKIALDLSMDIKEMLKKGYGFKYGVYYGYGL